MPQLAEIAVVHIALREYGLDAFAAFVGSYRRHAAGAEHRLIIAFKGFATMLDAEPFIALLDDVEHQRIDVPDAGYDIGTYFHVVRATEFEQYCFLNSRSLLLAGDWLAKLKSGLAAPGVGIAGATGSNESLLSDHLRAKIGNPSRSPARRWLRNSWINTVRHWLRFPPFPNPHLRTNAFIIRRSDLLATHPGRIRSRADTAKFENGRFSITRRLEKIGKKAVVVGRDGRIYEPSDWETSATFWQGGQENLLVADNQTAKYADADALTRAELEAKAWRPPI